MLKASLYFIFVTVGWNSPTGMQRVYLLHLFVLWKWGINDQHIVQWGIFSRTVYCFAAHCFRNVCLILAIFKVVACFDVTKYILIAPEIPRNCQVSYIIVCWMKVILLWFILIKNKPASRGSLWFYNTRLYFASFPKRGKLFPHQWPFVRNPQVTTMQNLLMFRCC